MKNCILVIIVLAFVACNQKKYENPHILIDTNYGDIEVELYPKQAPKTVAAFLGYVTAGYYKNTNFYRVLKNVDVQADYNDGIIQAGVYPNLKNVPSLVHEPTTVTQLKHVNGTISMASLGAGTATTEFFICIGEQYHFNAGSKGTTDKQGFAAFGSVVKGMGVVKNILNSKSEGDKLLEKIVINNISIL